MIIALDEESDRPPRELQPGDRVRPAGTATGTPQGLAGKVPRAPLPVCPMHPSQGNGLPGSRFPREKGCFPGFRLLDRQTLLGLLVYSQEEIILNFFFFT